MLDAVVSSGSPLRSTSVTVRARVASAVAAAKPAMLAPTTTAVSIVSIVLGSMDTPFGTMYRYAVT